MHYLMQRFKHLPYQTSIYISNCEKAFVNTHVDDNVLIFHEAILDIPSNFSPHEIVICDDKINPRLDKKIKFLIDHKLKTCKVYRRNRSSYSINRS